ncbi:MAG TPA: hypothetical protein VKG78_10995 [Opitutaceae bacterium]|nr:hypothetical protein [Opitutaceae bacterium]
MKNLSCLLSFSAIIGLVFVAACAALGVCLPFGSVILDIAGYSCGAGLFAFLLVDYAPRRGYVPLALRAEGPQPEVAPAAVSERYEPIPAGLPYDEATVNLFATLEMRNDPATVSLV